MLFYSCCLVIAGVVVLLRWRSRRAAFLGVVTIGAGIACLIVLRIEPSRDSRDHTEILCATISSSIDFQPYALELRHRRTPRPVSSEARAEQDVLKELFHFASEYCVPTPRECERILREADPTSAQFGWAWRYVASRMRKRLPCETRLPIPPAEDKWWWDHADWEGHPQPPEVPEMIERLRDEN
jgi:hypothetical protein